MRVTIEIERLADDTLRASTVDDLGQEGELCVGSLDDVIGLVTLAIVDRVEE